MIIVVDPAFEQRLNEVADRITVALDQLIPPASGPEAQLMRAMRHGALSKGKRLRPFITIEVGRMFGAQEKALLRGADLGRPFDTRLIADAFVAWTKYEAANLQLGQFKTPFGYDQLVPDAKTLFVERTLANDRLTVGRRVAGHERRPPARHRSAR